MRTEAETYARDGVVPVRGAVPPGAVAALLNPAEEIIAAALQEAEDSGFPPDMKHAWRRHAAFKRFPFESGLAALAAGIVGSRHMRLVIDQIWTKAPRSRQRTRWHYDYAAWPVSGEMLPSVWLALTPVSAENCLTFLAGSHRDPDTLGSGNFTDYDDLENAAGRRFLTWDLAPGDALVFHPCTYHACHGNTADHRRIAYTTRWAGDDVRYDPARRHIDEGVSFAACRAGEPLTGDDFPAAL